MDGNLVGKFMDEVIIYGGFPMRRRDVYQLALDDCGHSDPHKRVRAQRAADYFAFHFSAEVVDAEPMSLEEVRRITQEVDNAR